MKVEYNPTSFPMAAGASEPPTIPLAMRADSDSFHAHLDRMLSEKTDGTKTHPGPSKKDEELEKAFTDFVGQTLFGQLIASMRSTQGTPAYMHGGQAEKIFQNQLDQILSEEMTHASADSFAKPMYELFQLNRAR